MRVCEIIDVSDQLHIVAGNVVVVAFGLLHLNGEFITFSVKCPIVEGNARVEFGAENAAIFDASQALTEQAWMALTNLNGRDRLDFESAVENYATTVLLADYLFRSRVLKAPVRKKTMQILSLVMNQRGLDLRAVSSATQVPHKVLADLENERYPLTMSDLYSISKCFNISPVQFFSGDFTAGGFTGRKDVDALCAQAAMRMPFKSYRAASRISQTIIAEHFRRNGLEWRRRICADLCTVLTSGKLMMEDTLSRAFSKLRGQRGGSVEEIAAQTGICQDLLWSLDKNDGRYTVSFDVLYSICKAFGIKVDDFLAIGID